MDQLITYLSSPQGSAVREVFVNQSIEIIDEIGAEAVTYALDVGAKVSPGKVFTDSFSRIRNSRNTTNVIESFIDLITNTVTESVSPSERLVNARNVVRLLRGTNGVTPEGLVKFSQKISKEPSMVNSLFLRYFFTPSPFSRCLFTNANPFNSTFCLDRLMP